MPSREPLPDGIVWLTNDSDPLFASPEAQRGGTLHRALESFPLTFRVVGPDSNTSFRGAILGNQLGLTGIHPNTLNIIPELATHWAYGSDRKTMYFKLNPKARWSDGVPVTADDFAYTLDFMRSPFIVAPGTTITTPRRSTGSWFSTTTPWRWWAPRPSRIFT
jgi:microcin C transport system substrate-binding protein